MSSTFYERFTTCLVENRIPIPASEGAVLGSAVAVDAIAAKIREGITQLGAEATVADLVGAGFLADYWVAAGALTASYVAGVIVSCAAQAAAAG